MEKKPLGNTGIALSQLGLGTVKFGRNQALKFKEPFLLPTDAQIINLLAAARDLGVNLLDTAPAYGSSEERLGKLLHNRSEWVLATKVGEEFIDGESTYDFTPEHANFSIERSLNRLKTDYLDIVLVHSDGNDVHNIRHFGILDFLADLKKQGRIRAFGMSTKTVEGGMLAIDRSDVVMVTHNPAYTEELAVIQHAHKTQKGVLIKKALMSGHLEKITEKISEKNPVQQAIQFICQEPGVSSIILGTLSPLHLAEAVSYAVSVSYT